MSEVTQILSAIEQGDQHAAADLLPLVYEELRRLAARQLARESTENTLQATALVHEAFLRLVDPQDSHPWNGRTHFFRAAAESMRRILVDQARSKRSLKRAGAMKRVMLGELAAPTAASAIDVLALNEALDLLARRARKSRVGEAPIFCRFIC